MKRVSILLLLLLLGTLSTFAQIDQVKGTGIRNTSGPPTIDPPDIDISTEFALDIANRTVYIWNRITEAWERQLYVTQESGVPSGSPGTGPKLYWDIDTGRVYRWTGSAWSELGTGSAESIGPTTVVRRTLEVGDTITASTPGEFLAWFEFAPPTMSLTLNPPTTVYEVGTSNSIDLRVVTTNPAGATLSNGTLTRTNPASNTVSSFGAVAGDTVTISFTPTQAGSGDYNQLAYSFQATQDYSGTESGSISSNTISLPGVYPVFYGMASTDTTTVKGAIYSTLTKLVQAEGNKTISYTGSGLIYYAFPASWSDTNLSQILDPNGFDATASFTRTTATVSSSGLTNDYSTVSYIVYYLNTGSTTTSSSNYTFNR